MKKISRREFISKSSMAGAMIAGHSLVPNLFALNTSGTQQNPDISIANGTDYFAGTIKAVEQLGGIEKFVKKGDRVGLLANSGYKTPGTFTRPDVLLAVAWLCKEAGAAGIYSFKGEDEKYWRKSPLYEKYKSLIADIKEDESDHKEVEIEEGKILKEADVYASFTNYDKVINIPILKNHGEIHLTCTLKNTMGISSFGTNIKFHLGSNYVTGAVKMLTNPYHNMDHLAQCIADLNLIRKWDLNVVDATEFISTNGPSGPGQMLNENKIVAGADALAVEAVCGKYLDLKPQDSVMIQKAYANKLGEMNIDKLTISEVEV